MAQQRKRPVSLDGLYMTQNSDIPTMHHYAPIHSTHLIESQSPSTTRSREWYFLWLEWKSVINIFIVGTLFIYYFIRYQSFFGRTFSFEIENQYQFTATKIYDPVRNGEFVEWKETIPKLSVNGDLKRIKDGYLECDVFNEGKRNVSIGLLHMLLQSTCSRTKCTCIHAKQLGIKCNSLFLDSFENYPSFFMLEPKVIQTDVSTIADYRIDIFSDENPNPHSVEFRVPSDVTVQYIGEDAISYTVKLEQAEMSVCVLYSIY